MEDCTVISYPGPEGGNLLSLTDTRSKYMLPIGGRFRVVDFTLRNSFAAGVRRSILYTDADDDLGEYVSRYGVSDNKKTPRVEVVYQNHANIREFRRLITELNTRYYVIYNGDNPSIVSFERILSGFQKKKSGSVLFLLSFDKKATMAHRVLVTDQKTLLKTVNQAIKEKNESPNIFEMIINAMINRGIAKQTVTGYYWQIKSIPEYYDLNRTIIWDPEIGDLLYKEKIIQSRIISAGFAEIGIHGKITRSFVSDYCEVHGTVENSVLFPGVYVGENSHVKDSIILPFVRIGEGARIVRSVLDERRDLNPEAGYYNIGSVCRIGSTENAVKNKDFPQSVFQGVTLIGKDCRIPEGVKIGAGCYVASSIGESFAKKKIMYNGESLLK